MGYVFISYSSKNQIVAEKVRNILISEKIDCWMAPYSVRGGKRYAAEITSAIRNCSCFLLILSEESQNSDAVDSEVELAVVKYKKPIVTIKIDGAELNDAFAFYLNNKQLIDLREITRESLESRNVISTIEYYLDPTSDKRLLQNIEEKRSEAKEDKIDFLKEKEKTKRIRIVIAGILFVMIITTLVFCIMFFRDDLKLLINPSNNSSENTSQSEEYTESSPKLTAVDGVTMPDIEENKGVYYVLAEHGLQMRKSPSDNANVFTRITKGTKLDYIGYNEGFEDVYSYEKNCYGWVHASRISKDAP